MFLTYKIKPIITKTTRWLPGLLIVGVILTPSTALAASKTYAVVCQGSDVKLSHGKLTCSVSPAVVNIEGIGGPQKPYPTGAGVATITVDCGSYQPIDPHVGSPAKFKCKHGSSPSLSTFKVVQASSAPGPAPPSGPTSTCNASNCDLIAAYVNPIINVLSVMFGLIAVASIIMGGIQFTASEGDPQKASAAKNRIANTIFAFFAYALLYGFLQFLVPGGFLH